MLGATLRGRLHTKISASKIEKSAAVLSQAGACSLKWRCRDCDLRHLRSAERLYRAGTDPAFAQKQAQRLWSICAELQRWDWLSHIRFVSHEAHDRKPRIPMTGLPLGAL